MGRKARKRKEQKDKQLGKEKEQLKEVRREKNILFLFWKRWEFWAIVVAIMALIYYPIYLNMQNKKIVQAEDEVIIHTSMGDVAFKFYENDAPKTVENFKELSKNGFFDGLIFHRVIKDFMIQTGDPKGDGTGGPGYQFEDEINEHKIVAGSVAMANSGPDTNGSQFFIVTQGEQPHLNGKHTVFGEVTEGLDVAIAISEVPVDKDDKPITPIYINSIELK